MLAQQGVLAGCVGHGLQCGGSPRWVVGRCGPLGIIELERRQFEMSFEKRNVNAHYFEPFLSVAIEQGDKPLVDGVLCFRVSSS